MYEAYLADWEDFGPEAVQAVREYMDRSPKSREIFENVSNYIPLGVNSNQRYYKPYPLYFKNASGSRIWDVDDNKYIDFDMGYGALIVGHAHPLLIDTWKKQAEEGILYTHPYELLEELTDIISDLFDIDMFRFSNSENEATMFASRLARAYTGRDIMIKIEGGYHGTYDYTLVSSWPTRGLAGPRKMPVSVLDSLGLPEDTEELVRVVPFNDIEPLKELLEEEGDDIAGLIMEPIMMNAGIIHPKHGYLQEVRKLTKEYDIVLIFDEVKTGMRAYPGTASQLLGVKPDLITMAKAIGGGAAVSLVGGDEDIMSLIAPSSALGYQGVIHAGTYNANPFALRSVYTILTNILTKDAYPQMIKYCEELKTAYEESFDKHGIEAYIETFGVSGAIMFTSKKVTNFRQVLESDLNLWYPLFFSMVNSGLLPMAIGPEEMWTISIQHKEEDIETYIEAIDKAVSLMVMAKKYLGEK